MIVQMSDLRDPQYGRFGNQIFKYLFLKIVEREIDCEIRHSGWMGDLVFDLTPSATPEVPDSEIIVMPDDPEMRSIDRILSSIKQKIKLGFKVIELRGFFQLHSMQFQPYRDLVRDVFSINKNINSQLDVALHAKNLNLDAVMAVHLRRGDYLLYENNKQFWVTPIPALVEAISKLHFAGMKNAALYLCSDDLPNCEVEFKRHGLQYVTANELFTYSDDSLSLMVDFIMMSRAAINIISNSSLSFAASLINERSRVNIRPVPIGDSIEMLPFDPWNSNVLISRA